MGDYTHYIQKETGRIYVRTEQLDARNDMIPAIFDGKKEEYIPFVVPVKAPTPKKAAKPKTPKKQADNEHSAMLAELAEKEEADLVAFAAEKFGEDLSDMAGDKPGIIERIIALAAKE